ncbi:MAG: ATP-dependent metallopeptidase FtsH/Yme1/Tma family protein [Ruminococcaceae bacterium]|nr:ATP-dependent metallopeptidase FtsH/Yme1/Tma family protein [Oscillospiraceae bacterium]
MKVNFKVIIFYIVLIAAVIFMLGFMLSGGSKAKLQYSDIVDFFEKEQVTSFVIDDDNVLTMSVKTTVEGKEVKLDLSYHLRDVGLFYTDLGELIRDQRARGVLTDYDYEAPPVISPWLSFLPYILIMGLFVGLWFFMINRSMGGKGGSKINSFGKSKARLSSADKNPIRFKDVAGADEEKAELEEVVEFLKDPTRFTKLGAKIPHGVLLMGPPGTGKTLLAKAVAGEAGVPFYSISGSDFVEMYVGVGASRVRDLFDTAKKSPASIIFIDEIDAVGRHRGAGLGGGHDEREQTLNQLLVEMDGFGSNDGIIVMAATNRPDILDPALLRPGRFDRQITVNYPDIKGREDILKVHAKNKPLEGEVDLSVVAKSTIGFTGADLANLLNEAALLAARKGKSLIGMNDIEEAFTKVIVGPAKKSKVVSEKERKLTAYHEAGHAIVGYLSDDSESVHQISIIPAGRAGGYTLSLPKEDRSYRSKLDMETDILGLLGGRVAEKLILGDISTGASNDIQRATAIARSMVTKYGMSDTLGPIVYGSDHDGEVFLGRDFSATRDYSEDTAARIDAEIKRIVTEAYDRAMKLLEENVDKLHFVAGFLFKNEVMDGDQFAAAMAGNPTVEELEEMVAEKKRKSEEENAAKAKRDAEEAKRREEEEKERLEEQRRRFDPAAGADDGEVREDSDNKDE